MMNRREVTVDGVTIVYSDIGVGPPLVLMHGVPDSRESYSALVEELNGDESGYRIICPDFPGFGDSPEPGPDFDFLPDGLSGLWEGFFDAISLDEPAIVIVHDFGGPWLLPWVASQPERVRGLLILNTEFHPDFKWHFWARVWQTPVLGELATKMSTRSLFRTEMLRGDPALPPDYPDRCYEKSTPAMKRTLLRTYRAHKDPKTAVGPWWDKLKTALADTPVRVVWGDLDPYIPIQFADVWKTNVTHLTDVGHWVYISRPEVVVQATHDLTTGASG
jgi:pimeloyl-ACP methyl ester carboxylesterase